MSNFRANRYGFVEVDVTEKMYEEAQERSRMFIKLYGFRHTHRKECVNQRTNGYLAEFAVKEVFSCFEFSEDYSVDFVFNGITFECKSQGCNAPIYPEFDAMLYEEQVVKPTDYYIFTRSRNDSRKVYIAGFISQGDFYKKSTFVPPGTKNNNFTYEEPRYIIKYQELIKPLDFMAQLSELSEPELVA